MLITLASTGQDKQKILQETLGEFLIEPDKLAIKLAEVNSDIVEQPLDEVTTVQGASNRAINAFGVEPNSALTIGLEGGLVDIENNYYLVCVAVICDSDKNIYLGISSKLPLPKDVSEKIRQGEQFGIEIRKFRAEHQDDKNVLNLIDALINRQELFKQAIRNAWLKYENRKYF